MNNQYPTVRIVVPTLGKNRDWLEKCLQSITEQAIGAELVMVAPKDTPVGDLADRYGATLVDEKGKSLSEALNQGFENLSQSIRYLGWLGDDDILAPGSLALTVGALENEPNASLVLGRLRYIDGDGRSKWVVRSGAWAAQYAKLGKNFMGQPGSLMRRDAYELVGGLNPLLKNSMDQDLFLRLSSVGTVVYIPKELAAFRVHASSISSMKGAADESTDVAAKYAPTINRHLRPFVKAGVRVTDRILLSTLSRLPHDEAAMIKGKPYYRRK